MKTVTVFLSGSPYFKRFLTERQLDWMRKNPKQKVNVAGRAFTYSNIKKIEETGEKKRMEGEPLVEYACRVLDGREVKGHPSEDNKCNVTTMSEEMAPEVVEEEAAEEEVAEEVAEEAPEEEVEEAPEE